MAAEGNQDDNRIELDGETQEREKQISTLLSDSTLRDSLIQKLTEGGHVTKQNTSNQKKDGSMLGGYPFGSGGWPAFPVQFPFVPYPVHPAWGSSHIPPVAAGAGSSQLPHGSTFGSGQSGSSRVQGQEEGEKEDYLDLLDEDETLELVQFELVVDDDDAWKACDTINNFIKKSFTQVITPTARDGIMKDYPKPKIEALFAPKLDEDVKKQIERADKDPHYGVEKHLYNLQKQILDISGPLTCLWADLLNRDATVNPKDVMLRLILKM